MLADAHLVIIERPPVLAAGSLATSGNGTLSRVLVITAGLMGVALVAAGDLAAGDTVSLDLIHVVVVGTVAWFAGRLIAAFVAVAATGATVAVRLALGATPDVIIAAGVIAFVVLLALGIGLSTARGRSRDRELAVARDPLTGALTQGAFLAVAEHVRRRAVRDDQPMSLAHIDLDGFRDINHRLGRSAGDGILTAMVTTVISSVRGSDVLGRAGGDDFLLLLPATDARQALVVAERIRGLVRGGLGAIDQPVTASIGLATFRHPPPSVDDLLHGADDLLNEAKTRGGDTIVGQLVVTTRPTWDGLDIGDDIAYSDARGQV